MFAATRDLSTAVREPMRLSPPRRQYSFETISWNASSPSYRPWKMDTRESVSLSPPEAARL